MADSADALSVSTSEASRLFQPTRVTQSARPLSRSGGVDSLIASFNPLVQHSIRQLLSERADLLAELRMLEGAVDGVQQRRKSPPRVMQEKHHQLSENAARLQRLTGRESANTLMNAVRLVVAAAEDDGATDFASVLDDGGSGAAAVASRRHMVAARSGATANRSTLPHDLPTARGGRDIHNTRPADKTSYYESQQQKYGRGRRGSTSISGAWAEVLGTGAPSNNEACAPTSPRDTFQSSPLYDQQPQQQGTNGNEYSAEQESRGAVTSFPRSPPKTASPGDASAVPAAKLSASGDGRTSPSRRPAPHSPDLPWGGEGDAPVAAAAGTGSPGSLHPKAPGGDITEDALSLLAHVNALLAAEMPPAPSGARNSRTPPGPAAPPSAAADAQGQQDVSPRLLAAFSTVLGTGRSSSHSPGLRASSQTPGDRSPEHAAVAAARRAASHGPSPRGGPGATLGSPHRPHDLGDAATRALSPGLADVRSLNDLNTSGSNRGRMAARRGSSVSGTHVSCAQSSIAGLFSAGNAAAALPLARHTSSALAAASRSQSRGRGGGDAHGLSALLAGLPSLPAQHAVRELIIDLAELLHRREVLVARLAADTRRRPDEPPPRVLVDAEAGAEERLQRLARYVGRAGVAVVLAAVKEPDFREQMGLVGGAEEDVAGLGSGGSGGVSQLGGGVGGLLTTDDEEAHARVWRRRLDPSKVQPARHAAGGLVAREATATGGRQLWNIIATADPEAALSYYQKQQLRYGRARRGSTSIAGAWEQVYAEDSPVPSQGGRSGATNGSPLPSAASLQRSGTAGSPSVSRLRSSPSPRRRQQPF